MGTGNTRGYRLFKKIVIKHKQGFKERCKSCCTDVTLRWGSLASELRGVVRTSRRVEAHTLVQVQDKDKINFYFNLLHGIYTHFIIQVLSLFCACYLRSLCSTCVCVFVCHFRTSGCVRCAHAHIHQVR
jgi:hypothetical protein